MQGSRPARVGDQIREELSELLARQVKDPGIGFITLTHVKVSPDLQVARVFYTTLGDDKARRASAQALQRASPFLRRQLAGRLRLRRAPELEFFFDESIERHDRIERILREIEQERASRPPDPDAETPGAAASAEPDAEPNPLNHDRADRK